MERFILDFYSGFSMRCCYFELKLNKKLIAYNYSDFSLFVYTYIAQYLLLKLTQLIPGPC